MLKIKYKQFPEYLKGSDFYKNLTSKGSVYISEENFKENDDVNSLEDFKKIFKTINFFGLDYPEKMKEYFDKNVDEVYYYYFPQKHELNVFFMLKYFLGSEIKLKLYFEDRIKTKLDEIINYLNDKEKKSNKEYKYYKFYEKINFKSKLKKKYVRTILGILNILKTQNFTLFKDYVLYNIKDITFPSISLIKTENLGYFISLDNMNSNLKITEKGCFTNTLREDNIEIIGYPYGGTVFNVYDERKFYLDFEKKFGFILKLNDIYEPIKKYGIFKHILWFSSPGSNLPILNVYFSSFESLHNYEKLNKKTCANYIVNQAFRK